MASLFISIEFLGATWFMFTIDYNECKMSFKSEKFGIMTGCISLPRAEDHRIFIHKING